MQQSACCRPEVGMTDLERSKLKHRVKSNVFRAIETEKDQANTQLLALFLQSTFFQVLLLIFTFYSLVFDDFQALTCSKVTDSLFDGVSIFGMFIFLVELVLSSIYMNTYFNSYYFYLDAISMLSMLIDLNLMKDALNTSLS